MYTIFLGKNFSEVTILDHVILATPLCPLTSPRLSFAQRTPTVKWLNNNKLVKSHSKKVFLKVKFLLT